MAFALRAAILCGGIAMIGAIATCATSKASAAALNTAAFASACTSDANVTGAPGMAPKGKVTPEAFCDCVVGKLKEKKVSQTDVDMLVKMHKDAITDQDADKYPTLEDLLNANEGYEDACRVSLGMPKEPDSDEEAPADQEDIPQDQ